MAKKKKHKFLKEFTIESIEDIEKIFQGISSMFKNLWGFFTNPTKVFGIFKFLNIDLIYDEFLRNEKLIKILSFIVALLFVVSTRYTTPTNPFRTIYPISNYPLEWYQDSNNFVVIDSVIPESVNVSLSGERNQVEMVATKANFEVYADLRNLPVGTHQVELKHTDISGGVAVAIDPSFISVTLDRLIEEPRQVRADIMNEDLLPEYYTLGTPTLSSNQVMVRGAESIVSEIASVRALIDLTHISEIGEYEAPLVAFDSFGTRLNVEFNPAILTASVELMSNSVEVPFDVSITGNPPEGYSISEIIVEPEQIELFGEQVILDTIESFHVPIDLYQLNEDNEIWVDLERPDGIQYISEELVKINVLYEETEVKRLTDLTITRRNLGMGYEIESLEDNIVDVILRGAPNVLNQISETDLDVFIDLTGLEAGEHEVVIELETPDFVLGELSNRNVRVNITE